MSSLARPVPVDPDSLYTELLESGEDPDTAFAAAFEGAKSVGPAGSSTWSGRGGGSPPPPPAPDLEKYGHSADCGFFGFPTSVTCEVADPRAAGSATLTVEATLYSASRETHFGTCVYALSIDGFTTWMRLTVPHWFGLHLPGTTTHGVVLMVYGGVPTHAVVPLLDDSQSHEQIAVLASGAAWDEIAGWFSTVDTGTQPVPCQDGSPVAVINFTLPGRPGTGVLEATGDPECLGVLPANPLGEDWAGPLSVLYAEAASPWRWRSWVA